MMRNFYQIFLLILLSSVSLSAQDTIFRSFSVVQVENGVLVKFTIRGGITCSGVKVERSNDGINFNGIYEFAGVCGAIATDESYSFTDSNPVRNGYSYYRLDLGSLGLYSQVARIHFINYNSSGVAIFPNPCLENCMIYFSNPTNETVKIILINKLNQVAMIKEVTGSFIEISSYQFRSDIYMLNILLNNELQYTGKIVIP